MHINNDNSNEFAVQTVDMRVDYGDFVAVNELCLNVPRGEIYGLIGPNGAGKTSSFKVLATLMEPTYGDVFIGGVDISLQPEEARKHLGYMPDLAPIATDLKVWEFLDLFASAYGLSGKIRRTRIEECLGKVALDDKRNEYCKSLSRGMMQRLVWAKTLLHRPSLFLLDEPASGLDPLASNELSSSLKKISENGSAILMASHDIFRMRETCDKIGILKSGKLIKEMDTKDVSTNELEKIYIVYMQS